MALEMPVGCPKCGHSKLRVETVTEIHRRILTDGPDWVHWIAENDGEIVGIGECECLGCGHRWEHDDDGGGS